MKIINRKLYLPFLVLWSINNVKAQIRELSLREALNLASGGNREVQIKRLESDKSAEAVKEAKSYLLPSISISSSYQVYGARPVIYLRDESASPKLDDVKYGGRFAFDGSILASYPVANPVYKSNLRVAGISEEIIREEAMNAEEKLALNISRLYLAALMNEQQRQVMRQSLQRNERALRDSRSLFLQGKNLKTDTLSNYIAVKNLYASMSALENKFTELSALLKQMIGLEEDNILVFTDSISLPEQPLHITSSAFSFSLDNRKDIRIQSLQINQSKELLQNVKAEFKPQLTAIARYQVQNQSDDLGFWNGGLPRTYFAGLTLNIPVYSGNRLKHRTAQSEISIRQQEIALTDLKSRVQTELITLNNNLKEAYDQWQIQKQRLDAAQVNYDMMNERYHYGLASRMELSDAELALTRARLDCLQAVYSIRMIELDLRMAMGQLSLT